MRYPKGSVVITGAKDVPLLRMVRNCRFVGHQQLFELLQHEAVESSRESLTGACIASLRPAALTV
jgi:hypothetical protein